MSTGEVKASWGGVWVCDLNVNLAYIMTGALRSLPAPARPATGADCVSLKEQTVAQHLIE